MFVTGWINGLQSTQREFAELGDAYDYFRYLVYEDGSALTAAVYESQPPHGKLVTIVQWDAKMGEYFSPSHPLVARLKERPVA